MSLSQPKAFARRLFPRAYGKVQVHRVGQQLATAGSEWAQNALNDAILSTVIRKSLSPTSTAVDIGAAHGRFAREMAQVARNGSVLAIEPVPSLNAQLRRIFRSKKNVTVLSSALGREDRQADFWVCDSNVGLSGLTATSAAKRSGNVHSIVVPMTTLDSIAADHANVDLIKIDVEGGEYDVLVGAHRTLSQHRPIVAFECTWHAQESAAPPIETFKFLSQVGYRIFTPTGFLRGSKPVSQEYFVESISGGHEFFFFARHRGASAP